MEDIVDKISELKQDPNVLRRFLEHLSKTVVRDEGVKKAVLLTGVSAYTDNPINLFLKGPSSIGKTYVTREVLKYFPPDDVLFLGSLSPTALVHDYGVLIDESGQPIDPLSKPSKHDFVDERGRFDREAYKIAMRLWEDKISRARILVDLHNKILVFLEPPSYETFMRLRPLLSHDKEEISYKFVDRSGKGAPLRTLHVILRGWPSCVFCSTDVSYIEDLASRGFTITPEINEEKFREAIRKQADLESSPLQKILQDTEFELLRGYISVISTRAKIHATKSFPVTIPYAKLLAERYPTALPRDMRDFSRLLALIKASTVLHIFRTPQLVIKDGREELIFWIATLRDLEIALNVFRFLEETTRTGLPKNILDFYHEVIEKLDEPTTIGELTEKYNNERSRPVSSRTIRRWCNVLADAGLIDVRPDPDKKSRLLITPLKSGKIVKETGIFGILENCRNSMPELLKEWFIELQKNWTKNGMRIYVKLPSGLIVDDPKDFSLIADENFVQNYLGKNQASFGETAEKIRQIEKLPDLSVFLNEKSAKKILRVKRLDKPLIGWCEMCCNDHREKKVLVWRAETFCGDVYLLCEDCGQKQIKALREEGDS
ncbi:MAG: hypothetical protein QXR17_05235 [Candidatus Bathyarchaeia archaeon]